MKFRVSLSRNSISFLISLWFYHVLSLSWEMNLSISLSCSFRILPKFYQIVQLGLGKDLNLSPALTIRCLQQLLVVIAMITAATPSYSSTIPRALQFKDMRASPTNAANSGSTSWMESTLGFWFGIFSVLDDFD